MPLIIRRFGLAITLNFGDDGVILSGIHPEAAESWRGGMNFTTLTSVDNAHAAMLIGAALNRMRLEHF